MSKKYNLGQPLTRIDGTVVPYGMLDLFPPPMDPKDDPSGFEKWRKEGVPLWRLVQRAVLEAKKFDENGQEQHLTETEKFERYQLALRLSNADHVELDHSQVQMIRSTSATVFHTEVMGAIWTALENPVTEGE